jgi:hypothetical protein
MSGSSYGRRRGDGLAAALSIDLLSRDSPGPATRMQVGDEHIVFCEVGLLGIRLPTL